jgi:hypothetical protein
MKKCHQNIHRTVSAGAIAFLKSHQQNSQFDNTLFEFHFLLYLLFWFKTIFGFALFDIFSHHLFKIRPNNLTIMRSNENLD